MNVMIVHVLLCNLFLYKLFMHACIVAESTLCTLSSVLLLFLSNNPLESTSTRSQNITPFYIFAQTMGFLLELPVLMCCWCSLCEYG